ATDSFTENTAHMPEADAAPADFSSEEHSREQQDHQATEEFIAPPITSEPSEAPLETVAEGEQPSAAAEAALTAEGTVPETADGNGEEHHDDEAVESVGGADALEEAQERMPRFRRQYKIQEVIKRRQVMLVQVVKEERGTK